MRMPGGWRALVHDTQMAGVSQRQLLGEHLLRRAGPSDRLAAAESDPWRKEPSRPNESDPIQSIEKMNFVGKIGIGAGKLPMSLCIDRLDAFHLANQNVALLGSPELAQGVAAAVRSTGYVRRLCSARSDHRTASG